MYFNGNKNGFGKTFNFELHSSDIKNGTAIKVGEYYMALYVLEAEKSMYGRTQKIELLTPVLYDKATGLSIDDRLTAEQVYAKSQESGSVSVLANSSLSQDDVLNMRYEMTERINAIRQEFMENQMIMIESYKDMQTKQYQEYYKCQLDHLNQIYEKHIEESQHGLDEETRNNAKKVLPIDLSKIERMEDERDNAFNVINSANVSGKEPRLLSISHVTII